MVQNEVSIVIVNYNTFNLTCDCVDSIIKNEPTLRYEIIIIDNASTEIAAPEFKKIFPQITLIESKENIGFAKGNNMGIDRASGEYILLLNSDTILLNNAVSIALEFLHKHYQVSAVAGRLEFPNGKIQHNCQRFPNIKYQLIELFRLQKVFPELKKKLFGPFFNYKEIAYPDWIWGTFFMFRKSILNELAYKKLADDFFMYVEDMQWCMEFSLRGYKIAFVPQAHVMHLMGSSGAAKNELIENNHSAFMKMYYSGWKRVIINFLKKLLTFRHAG